MTDSTLSNTQEQDELTKAVDDIVYRCFAQGQYWGTGSGEDGELDPDYLPDDPIDRTEAVKLLVALLQPPKQGDNNG